MGLWGSGLEAWRQIPASWCWKKPGQIEREAIRKLLQDVMVVEICRAIFVFGVDCFFFWLPEVLYEWKSREIVRRNLSYHIQMPVKAHDIWAKWNINNLGNFWTTEIHPIYTMVLEWYHPALAFWRFDHGLHSTCPCRSLSAREDFHIGPAAKMSFNDGISTSVGLQITLQQANIAGWKMDHLKMCFLLKIVISRCHVSLPEGKWSPYDVISFYGSWFCIDKRCIFNDKPS